MLLVDLRGSPKFHVPENAEEAHLDAGDALSVSSNGMRIGIEHKTISSVMWALKNGEISTGHLADQLSRCINAYDLAILMIQGMIKVSMDPKTKSLVVSTPGVAAAVKYNAYIAAITSIQLRGAGIIFTPNAWASCAAMEAVDELNERTQRGEERRLLVSCGIRVPPNVAMLSQLSGWGPKLAEGVLAHCGSLRSLLLMTDEELCEVPGLGPRRREVLKHVLDYTL